MNLKVAECGLSCYIFVLVEGKCNAGSNNSIYVESMPRSKYWTDESAEIMYLLVITGKLMFLKYCRSVSYLKTF